MVSLKDAFKLVGVTVVVFCAVFVNTFFLNFCIDAQAIKPLIVGEEMTAIYNAQMATAKFACAISGAFLSLIAVVLLMFYSKLYIDRHKRQLGILKAMGYGSFAIALRFVVFGVSVLLGALLGCGAGFAVMPTVYKGMTISGLPTIPIRFHIVLPLLLIFVPTAVFSVFVCGYAYFALQKPALSMLREQEKLPKKREKEREEKVRPFLQEMQYKTASSKKTIAFLIAFSGFCVAAMVQMAVSMNDLAPDTVMGEIIFGIGVVLALTTLFMAVTSLTNANTKNISVMKAFGYSLSECFRSVLAVYHIFALFGYAVGTVYQYVLLKIMVDIVYKDVAAVPAYNFGWEAFFIVLAAFAVLYEAVMGICVYKINKISLKEVMTEN